MVTMETTETFHRSIDCSTTLLKRVDRPSINQSLVPLFLSLSSLHLSSICINLCFTSHLPSFFIHLFFSFPWFLHSALFLCISLLCRSVHFLFLLYSISPSFPSVLCLCTLFPSFTLALFSLFTIFPSVCFHYLFLFISPSLFLFLSKLAPDNNRLTFSISIHVKVCENDTFSGFMHISGSVLCN